MLTPQASAPPPSRREVAVKLARDALALAEQWEAQPDTAGYGGVIGALASALELALGELVSEEGSAVASSRPR